MLVVLSATLTAFFPSLHGQFVNWDDDFNLLDNPHYRGLSWPQIKWMFTTFYLGPYQPLSWLSLALDYRLWGMDPFGYHLSSLLLHAANAGLFYLLAIRLLELGAPTEKKTGLYISAGFAAMVFALHPLRVESVAWVTERRDVLSGMFYLPALLFYLKAHAQPPKRGLFLFYSGSLFALALLSKAIVMSLPVVLLILDCYPLRRLPANPRRWFQPECRAVWLEKIPFFLLASAAAILGFIGQSRAGVIHTLSDYTVVARISHTCFSLAFYLLKTLVPLNLIHLYEAPKPVVLWVRPYWPCAAAVLAVTGAVVAARRRWPAGLAVWAYYIVALLPVIGIVKFGQQITADRYSYLACLGWALLAGSILLWALRAGNTAGRGFALVVAAVLCLKLGALTRRQVLYWHDSQSLWKHFLSVVPGHLFAHNNLGTALADLGRHQEAAAQYQAALAINPGDLFAHYNMGNSLFKLGRALEAIEHFRKAAEINPGYVQARLNLAYVLGAQGRLDEAVEAYEAALQIDGSRPETHTALGDLLRQQGHAARALDHYRQALRLNPRNTDALNGLGIALAQGGKFNEAVETFRAALALNPGLVQVHHNLGTTLADQGRFDEAVEQYRLALALNPDYEETHFNVGNILARSGRYEDAAGHYREVLRLRPGHAGAEQNLRAVLGRAREQ